jgi:hypothetical protein
MMVFCCGVCGDGFLWFFDASALGLFGWGGGVVGIFALFSGFAGGSGALLSWRVCVGVGVLGLFVVPCWRV